MDRTLKLRLEKWAIWLGLIAVLFLLRHLFPIIFLTFVLSYLGNTAVEALTRRFRYRKLNVVLIYLALLAILAGVVLLVVPRMLIEARNLAREYIATEAAREETGDSATFMQRQAREVVDSVLVTIAGREAFLDFQRSDAYTAIVTRIDKSLTNVSSRVATEVTAFANVAISVALQFVLAILLSFLLIWDLPKTREGLGRFAEGRTADIYREIVPGLKAFGTMLGRAFEAQSVVAVVNAILSTIVFLLLGLPSIALLAMIVFVCSYIPILGMFLSTLPAAFLALRLGGITHVLWLIAGIAVIHVIEAYMLNPLIYGRHLRLHPLATLVILMVAEHLFGVWGLLLGVPLAAFVLKYVIEGESVT
ncbi:MAG TPA: AI-2E family transporter [Thermoanaerobaculia bacterium]|jgi:predicted PurR-regulated permease PerM|nr:AI-2E family transporter [Thermoanaerobaculia bacterium]